MRAAIIDPGDFSPQYDLALSRALAGTLSHCRLIGRHGFDETARPAFRRDHFYACTQWPLLRSLPPAASKLVKGLSHAPDLWRLARWLDREAIDIVHFQWLPLPAIDAALWPRLVRHRGCIVTMHDSNPYNGAEAGWMTRGLDALLARADAVIVHTRQAGERLVERGLPASLIRQLPHGLLHPPAARTSRRPARGDKLRLLQFGKIKPYKGVDILIDALRELGPAIRDRLEVRVVGKPYMDMAPLQRAIERHGLGGCLALELGYLPEAEIERLFAEADVAVFPYREIDASGVVMTAIAQGLPVIASRAGGFGELFADGVGGSLFEVGDASGLARTIESWVLDPDQLARQSAGILAKRAAVPGWPEIAEQTKAIYAQVLAAKRRGCPLPAAA